MIDTIEPFLVAGAIGLLIGAEREHHAWREREPIAAGTRTFALLALLGALSAAVGTGLVIAGFAFVAALVIAGYWRTSREHHGTTTEVSAAVTFLLGAIAIDHQAVAAGIGVGVALLLEQKSRLHALLHDAISDEEMDDALRYVAMALVVLPLLPDDPVDRWGVVSPRDVWTLVIVLAGIGWVGHIATRVLGPRRGLVVTGAAGGFVSASATTAMLGRMARRAPGLERSALAAALAASVATCAQIVAVVAVVDRPLGVALVAPMALAGLALIAEVAVLARRAAPTADADETPPHRRPLQFAASLGLAGVITATLLVSAALTEQAGDSAVVVTAGVAGLADTHGASVAAVSLVDSAGVSRSAALVAVALALATNTVTKIVLAFTAGGASFGRRFALAMVAPIALATTGFALVAPRV